MPNQRKKGKKQIAFWVEAHEKVALKKAAKKAGFKSVTAWLKSLITSGSAGFATALGLLSMHVHNPRFMAALAAFGDEPITATPARLHHQKLMPAIVRKAS